VKAQGRIVARDGGHLVAGHHDLVGRQEGLEHVRGQQAVVALGLRQLEQLVLVHQAAAKEVADQVEGHLALRARPRVWTWGCGCGCGGRGGVCP